MRKRKIPRKKTKPKIVNMNGQLYGQTDFGQMVRLDRNGNQIPRVRLSKKEKIKLRRELHDINEMDSHELANRIIEKTVPVPVVNPKSGEQLKAEQEAVADHA
jgi:hypothetical protein